MKSSMIKSAVAMVFAAGFAAASMAAPTTVEGTGVGKHGDITVAVTFDAGKIQNIEVVKAPKTRFSRRRSSRTSDEVVALVDGRRPHLRRHVLRQRASSMPSTTPPKGGRDARQRPTRRRSGSCCARTAQDEHLRRGRDRCGRRGFSAAITAKTAAPTSSCLKRCPPSAATPFISGAG